MISDNDLDDCFLTDDFASEASFTVGGSPVTVSGYFTAGTDAVQVFGTEIEAVAPTFVCKTADTSGVGQGTAVTVNAAGYTVEKIQTVGNGVTVCYLKA